MPSEGSFLLVHLKKVDANYYFFSEKKMVGRISLGYSAPEICTRAGLTEVSTVERTTLGCLFFFLTDDLSTASICYFKL